MDKRVWLSRRALKLHAVILVVVPAFMALCVWQITRALGGNSLSWAYVFEWPIFAGYAVYMWWRFVHEAAEDTLSPAQPDDHGGPAQADTGAEAGAGAGAEVRPAQGSDEQSQDADLAAYNAYLAELAEQDKTAGR
jgi:hypothetical protein